MTELEVAVVGRGYGRYQGGRIDGDFIFDLKDV